jgi:hypothetical protein
VNQVENFKFFEFKGEINVVIVEDSVEEQITQSQESFYGDEIESFPSRRRSSSITTLTFNLEDKDTLQVEDKQEQITEHNGGKKGSK